MAAIRIMTAMGVTPPPCTREEGLGMKDENAQWDRDWEDCNKRCNKPGYEKIMNCKLRGV